jgi:L-threonylcarbamoyladenylate synthase
VAAPGIVAATRMPADKPGYARALYGTLHALDALGVDAIWLEMPPRDEGWRDVHDRLSRAATPG